MRSALTYTERVDIYNHLQDLVSVASDVNCSIYDGLSRTENRISDIRDYLEKHYSFRFVQFKDEDTYITDLSYSEQWIFALFISEFILHGDYPE